LPCLCLLTSQQARGLRSVRLPNAANWAFDYQLFLRVGYRSMHACALQRVFKTVTAV
jgi:hypothetical protein